MQQAQQKNTVRMKLKTVLWQLNISQSQLAAALEKDNGEPVSQSTVAQLVNHNQWPKTMNRQALERKIKELLFARGANDDHIPSRLLARRDKTVVAHQSIDHSADSAT